MSRVSMVEKSDLRYNIQKKTRSNNSMNKKLKGVLTDGLQWQLSDRISSVGKLSITPFC